MLGFFLKWLANCAVVSMAEAYWSGFLNNVLATDRWVAVRNSAAPTSIASSMKASVSSSARLHAFYVDLGCWRLPTFLFKFWSRGFSFLAYDATPSLESNLLFLRVNISMLVLKVSATSDMATFGRLSHSHDAGLTRLKTTSSVGAWSTAPYGRKTFLGNWWPSI